MQDKIKKKMIKNIVLSTLLFIMVTSIISGFFIVRNYIRSFEDASKQSVTLATSYSQIKLENISSDSFRLTENEVILEGLSSNQYEISINPTLNFLRSQYQEEIDSIVLYAENDMLYKSDSIPVTSIVPLSRIIEEAHLNQFLTSSEQTVFFIQSNQQLITHFSFIHKVMVEDQLLGYLLINMRPTYFLSQFFLYDNIASMNLENQYIVVGEEKLYFMNKETSSEIEQSGFINLSTYVIHDDLYQSTFPLITKVSTEQLVNDILTLTIVMLIVDLIAITFAYFSARHLSYNIANQFERLKEKMISGPKAIK